MWELVRHLRVIKQKIKSPDSVIWLEDGCGTLVWCNSNAILQCISALRDRKYSIVLDIDKTSFRIFCSSSHLCSGKINLSRCRELPGWLGEWNISLTGRYIRRVAYLAEPNKTWEGNIAIQNSYKLWLEIELGVKIWHSLPNYMAAATWKAYGRVICWNCKSWRQ